MIDLKELRHNTLEVIKAQTEYRIHPNTKTFDIAEEKVQNLSFEYETIIELLNRLEAAEKVCDAAVQYTANDSVLVKQAHANQYVAMLNSLESWQEVKR